MPKIEPAVPNPRISSAAEHAANPFALLIDPAALIAATLRSGPLRAVPRRILRPLDKAPLPRFEFDHDAGSARAR